MRYYLVIPGLLTMTLFIKNVSGECANNCEWTSWFNWDCSRCCSTGQRFAIRQRGICCHNSTNPLVCLDRCDKQQIDMQDTDYCPPHCDECSTTMSRTAATTPSGMYSQRTNHPIDKVTQKGNTISSNQLITSRHDSTKISTKGGLQDCQMTEWSKWNCAYCSSHNIALRQRGISCTNFGDPVKCLQHCGRQRNDIQETEPSSSHCGSCKVSTSVPIIWSSTELTPTHGSSKIPEHATRSHFTLTASKKYITTAHISSISPSSSKTSRSTQLNVHKTSSIASKFTSLISKQDTSPKIPSLSINRQTSTVKKPSRVSTQTSITMKNLQTKSNPPKESNTNTAQTLASTVPISVLPTVLSTNTSPSPKISTTYKTKLSTLSHTNVKLQPNFVSVSKSSGNIFLSPQSVKPTNDNSNVNQKLSTLTSGTTPSIVGNTMKISTNAIREESLDSLDSVGSVLSDGFPSIATIVSSALADTGCNDTEECRLECAGKDTWDTCLKECFNRPCDNMLLLVSPCLFILGVIVGTTITCIVRSLVNKLKKKKRTGEDNSVLPFKEYLNY